MCHLSCVMCLSCGMMSCPCQCPCPCFVSRTIPSPLPLKNLLEVPNEKHHHPHQLRKKQHLKLKQPKERKKHQLRRKQRWVSVAVSCSSQWAQRQRNVTCHITHHFLWQKEESDSEEEAEDSDQPGGGGDGDGSSWDDIMLSCAVWPVACGLAWLCMYVS